MPAREDRWVSSFFFLLFYAVCIPMLGSASLLQELSPHEYFSGLQASKASLAYFSHSGMYLIACIYISLVFRKDSCQSVCESAVMKGQFLIFLNAKLC
uniref:Uncharacterized protein n=1 Tax=Pavo cristatus TaxID=9049 RepID=A0A8C9ESX6_PAVCR